MRRIGEVTSSCPRGSGIALPKLGSAIQLKTATSLRWTVNLLVTTARLSERTHHPSLHETKELIHTSHRQLAEGHSCHSLRSFSQVIRIPVRKDSSQFLP
jgi:hypothetical protein